MTTQLSKSLFLRGVQCLRQVWSVVHEDTLEDPDIAAQSVIDNGIEVGALARTYVPDGVLVEGPHTDVGRLIAETRAAMDGGQAVLYEAAFAFDGVLVRADIIEKQADGSWALIEVKSSTKVKSEHHLDAAIQLHVIRGTGVAVSRVELMHINRECRYPNLGDLFVRVDITDDVEGLVDAIPAQLAEIKKTLIEGDPPPPEPGRKCWTPDDCLLKEECWSLLPDGHLLTLYLKPRKLLEALGDLGVTTIEEIPDDQRLNAVQARQREAARTGQLVIDKGALRGELERIEYPVAHLDFETIRPVIPRRWEGTRPYDQIPVQVSVHIEQPDGSLTHHEWLSDGALDPRDEMAERIIEFIGDAPTVAAYSAGFEKGAIDYLIEHSIDPDTEARLTDIKERLWDPLKVIRATLYHPGFGGGFSVKVVAPALMPGFQWSEDGLSDGMTASVLLEQLLLDGIPDDPVDRSVLRSQLLTYCRTDTLATAQLHAALRELAGLS